MQISNRKKLNRRFKKLEEKKNSKYKENSSIIKNRKNWKTYKRTIKLTLKKVGSYIHFIKTMLIEFNGKNISCNNYNRILLKMIQFKLKQD